MSINDSLYKSLGYGVLDINLGKWDRSNDVAGYSYVNHANQDNKYLTREFLRILGKRFSPTEAFAIKNEVEQYRAELECLYSPSVGAIGHISFEKAAQDWYNLHGVEFEKQWYLNMPLEIHFARTGREHVKGRWLRILNPDFLAFCEAGFSPSNIYYGLKAVGQSNLLNIILTWVNADKAKLAQLWVKLAAYLMGFCIDNNKMAKAMTEITLHATRLSFKLGYPVGTAEVALDYFQRLELSGLGIEAITGVTSAIDINKVIVQASRLGMGG
ncbi:MAG: hypothetical protein HXX08_20525 [Chloroflexi bacterium]|uniref:Uncharacterized protein n=1 Tax=Candidatus Chlorohelix allophototropha TaxID=3003348 RepID=A0A8T7M7X8_9CHLR|nr:hypothetical protein [Chloroflexota bacterium]WJW68184.1 hypothetical protein OZ401_003788 [Chloroflexota bacterium L227-S17]